MLFEPFSPGKRGLISIIPIKKVAATPEVTFSWFRNLTKIKERNKPEPISRQNLEVSPSGMERSVSMSDVKRSYENWKLPPDPRAVKLRRLSRSVATGMNKVEVEDNLYLIGQNKGIQLEDTDPECRPSVGSFKRQEETHNVSTEIKAKKSSLGGRIKRRISNRLSKVSSSSFTDRKSKSSANDVDFPDDKDFQDEVFKSISDLCSEIENMDFGDKKDQQEPSLESHPVEGNSKARKSSRPKSGDSLDGIKKGFIFKKKKSKSELQTIGKIIQRQKSKKKTPSVNDDSELMEILAARKKISEPTKYQIQNGEEDEEDLEEYMEKEPLTPTNPKVPEISSKYSSTPAPITPPKSTDPPELPAKPLRFLKLQLAKVARGQLVPRPDINMAQVHAMLREIESQL